MSCFNTASGKYYCNSIEKVRPFLPSVCQHVSIPQAVSTIAIFVVRANVRLAITVSFNTASGKYYCNLALAGQRPYTEVSIPQAVSTIAIYISDQVRTTSKVSIPQAVSTIAIRNTVLRIGLGRR